MDAGCHAVSSCGRFAPANKMHAKQELVDSYADWYHEIDFGDGVRSRPKSPPKHVDRIWEEIERFLAEVDFQDRTVLDIGCWDGRWSFLAEKRGASRVVAVDAGDQRWGATRGFEIARSLFKSRAEYRGNVNIHTAPAQLGGERFDVVLFLGVYYHLVDAVHGLAQLRHLVADGGIVIIEGSAINDTERAYAEFLSGPGPEPERVDVSTWTIPTRRWMVDVMQACYFSVRRECFPFAAPRGRVLVEGAAGSFENRNHPYPPPFGLHVYDPRWQARGAE
jgi:tRNA (mo5U34)-methyltransferase